MPNTTNFNWPTPADTDLVKDGAAAIRNLGNGIDTSLIDLKGGTTGQILSKASNADMDFTFITPNVGDITEVQAGVGISVASGTGPIPVITNSSTDLITTAGDLLYGTAADTVARLGIGTANQVLRVNSGATAPEWATPASGALTKITTTAFTGATSVSVNNCFTSTYRNYLIVLDDLNSGGNASDVYIQWQYSTNTVQATNYYSGAYYMSSNGSSGNYNRSNSTSITLGQFTNLGRGIVHINVCNVGNSSEDACWSGIANGANSTGVSIFGGSMDAAQTYTGFKISAANNIVGNLTVYGLEI